MAFGFKSLKRVFKKVAKNPLSLAGPGLAASLALNELSKPKAPSGATSADPVDLPSIPEDNDEAERVAEETVRRDNPRRGFTTNLRVNPRIVPSLRPRLAGFNLSSLFGG